MQDLSDPNPDFGWPHLLDPMGEVAPVAGPAQADIYTVTAFSVPLLESATKGAQTVSTLLYGEPIVWLETTSTPPEGLRRCQSLIDGYQGYLDPKAVDPMQGPATHRVATASTHIYSAANIKSPPMQRLPYGACLQMAVEPATDGPVEGKFIALAAGGHVLWQHLKAVDVFANDPVAEAERFLGVPYLWGGRSVDGIDCSGLVQVTLAACSVRVLRDSGSQFRSIGPLLPNSESPRRGDLAFFPGHVGWMVDETSLLHANATHMAVTIDPLEDVIGWVVKETDKPPFSGFVRPSLP